MLGVKLDISLEDAQRFIDMLSPLAAQGSDFALLRNYLILCREQAIRGAATEAITELQAGGM